MQITKESTDVIPSLKSSICQRLKQARVEAGYTTAKSFAELNDLKVSTYALHEAGTRGMSFDVIETYSRILNIHVCWLLANVGPKNKTEVREVPIIEWDEVLEFKGKSIHLNHEMWTSSDVDLSPESFALVVSNDSMEPRYPEGTVIIVDRQQTPQNKEFAVLAIKGKEQPIFKQLVQVDGEWFAKSLNPAYKAVPIPKNSNILGKVVQAKFLC